MRSVVSVKSWFITYFKVGHHCFRSQIRHELQAFEQMKRKGYGQVIVQFSSGLDFKVRISVEGWILDRVRTWNSLSFMKSGQLYPVDGYPVNKICLLSNQITVVIHF